MQKARIPDNYVPDKTRDFIASIVYAQPEYIDVVTAMMFVSWVVDTFSTVPHGLATADSAHSGKSTIMCDIPMLLARNAWKVGKNTTTDALRNKYLERERPNIVADDVGKIFGDAGQNGKTSQVYALLIDCYRSDGVVSVSRNGSTQDLPSFGMAFMNGLRNAVPHDLFTRSIWFRMTEAPSGMNLRDALDVSTKADAKAFRDAIRGWAGARKDLMSGFMRGKVAHVHPKLEKRRRQIWGPLFAFADAAGGDWPRRMYQAFVTMALDAGEKPVPLPEQQVVLDTADILMRRGLSEISTGDLVALLRENPAGSYYREVEDKYLVETLLPAALGPAERLTTTVLTGEHRGLRGRVQGRKAAPILEAAADLHEQLNPDMPLPGTDSTELELNSFEPCPTVKGRNR